jgi:hypothetical protein
VFYDVVEQVIHKHIVMMFSRMHFHVIGRMEEEEKITLYGSLNISKSTISGKIDNCLRFTIQSLLKRESRIQNLWGNA